MRGSLVLWVQGLRVPDTATQEWQAVLFRRLEAQFDGLVGRKTTRRAEGGLNLRRSVYWYVGRTHPEFAYVAVTHDAPTDDGASLAPPYDSGVLPFDSGGLWEGHIETRPAMTLAEKKELAAAMDHRVSTWRGAFGTWVGSAYTGSVPSYVDGTPPAHCGASQIVPGPPNTSRAWTWEGRVRAVAYAGRDEHPAPPVQIFITEDDSEAYLDWLRSKAPLSSMSEYREHRNYVQDRFVLADDVYGALQGHLMGQSA